MKKINFHINTEDNNMPILGSLPTSGSKKYNSFCEVDDELSGIFDAIFEQLGGELKKRDEIYLKYFQEDHSDIGPHFHAFDDIPLMNGYKGCNGTFWSQEARNTVAVAVIKECDVRNISYVMTLIHPSPDDELEPAFFTEKFLQNYGVCTKSPRNLFFLETAYNDSLFSENDMGEIRLLLSKGVAFGYRYCHFCVFNEFTDVLKYPAGNVSSEDRDALRDSLWNDI